MLKSSKLQTHTPQVPRYQRNAEVKDANTQLRWKNLPYNGVEDEDEGDNSSAGDEVSVEADDDRHSDTPNQETKGVGGESESASTTLPACTSTGCSAAENGNRKRKRNEDRVCVICMCVMKQATRLGACKHEFCFGCISREIGTKNTSFLSFFFTSHLIAGARSAPTSSPDRLCTRVYVCKCTTHPHHSPTAFQTPVVAALLIGYPQRGACS